MTNPVEQDAANRAGDIIEFLSKAGGLVVLIASFLKWAWKPYVEWRRKRLAELIKEVLGPELLSLKNVVDREDGCIDRLDVLVDQIRQLFDEHDLLTKVVFENRDRLDEFADLLTHMGLDNERRRDPERLSQMLDQLEERRNARRRRLPIKEDESDAPIRNRKS